METTAVRAANLRGASERRRIVCLSQRVHRGGGARVPLLQLVLRRLLPQTSAIDLLPKVRLHLRLLPQKAVANDLSRLHTVHVRRLRPQTVPMPLLPAASPKAPVSQSLAY